MCKSLRYCVTHCLYVAMTKLDEANREANMHSSIRYLGYLARTSLLVAICMGLYVRWEKTEESLILVIFILGLFVLGIASILYYYFSMEAASLCLSHLWFGFLLGLLCFIDNSSFKDDLKEDATKYLLLSSMAIRTLCSLVERICGCVFYRPTLLTAIEFLELLGFAVASMTILLEKSTNIILLVAALAMLIIDMRMKSCLAVPNLVIFGVIASLLFFPSLDIHVNPFALGCFFICLVCDPLFDVYFSGLSVTERWKPYLFCGAICRRLSVIFVGCVELIFFILSTFILGHLKIWYFVIPGFSIFGIFWLVCHIIFLITLWGFHTKLNDCHRVYSTHRTENSRLDRVMASKGMRHFCLISERLVFFSLIATAVFGAVSWQKNNGIFMSVFLIVLPLESMAHGLFHELGNCLGGTCIGYAIVIPTNFCSPEGQPTLLPPEHVQELNLRSTGILNAVQRFFAHHMVENYGCDYSTSGLSLETLNTKLKSFLDLRTADGPRHDTYILYYSGHSHGSGEWALADVSHDRPGGVDTAPANDVVIGQPSPVVQLAGAEDGEMCGMDSSDSVYETMNVDAKQIQEETKGTEADPLVGTVETDGEAADGNGFNTINIYCICCSKQVESPANLKNRLCGETFRLDTLLEWWREKNGIFCSRLIIVLDCENSHPWVKDVSKVSNLYIAVQGAEMTKVVDLEEAECPQIGDFTNEWVEYNCDPENNISWSEKGRTVKAIYGVSRHWSDYMLHLPTETDIAKHWMIYFPRITYPFVHLANWFCGLNLFWVCKTCYRCLKRLKMNWFLPAVLDTGQGFKLVKSHLKSRAP